MNRHLPLLALALSLGGCATSPAWFLAHDKAVNVTIAGETHRVVVEGRSAYVMGVSLGVVTDVVAYRRGQRQAIEQVSGCKVEALEPYPNGLTAQATLLCDGRPT